jgi:hypothetical protein
VRLLCINFFSAKTPNAAHNVNKTSTLRNRNAHITAANMANIPEKVTPSAPRMPLFRPIPQKEWLPIGAHREYEECRRNRELLLWQVRSGQMTAIEAEWRDRLPGEKPRPWTPELREMFARSSGADLPLNLDTFRYD